MAEDVIDDSISILQEAYSSGYQGNTEEGIPQFQIYSGRPSDVEEASHYALRLTCHTLQKRNHELETQIYKLQRETRNKNHPGELANSDRSSLSPESQRNVKMDPDDKKWSNSNNGIGAQEEFIHYLQKQLNEAQQSKRDLASKLDTEKAMVYQLKSKINTLNSDLDESLKLLQTRRSERDEMHDKNDTLKSVIENLRKEMKEKASTPCDDQNALGSQVLLLKAELSSMQQLYEETASQKEQIHSKFSTLRQEKSILEQTIEEKDRTIERLLSATNGVPLRSDIICTVCKNQPSETVHNTSVSEGSLLEHTKLEIAALQAQVIEMQRIIHEQTSLIRLLVSKLRHRTPPITGGTAVRSDVVQESEAVLCEEDLESLGLEQEEPRTLVLPANHILNNEITGQNVSGRATDPRDNPLALPQPQTTPMIGLIRNNDPTVSVATGSTGTHHAVDGSISTTYFDDATATHQGTRNSTFNFHTEAVLRVRGQSEPLIRHPPGYLLPGQSRVTETLVPGDNRFSHPRTASTGRLTIQMERNTDDDVHTMSSSHVTDVNVADKNSVNTNTQIQAATPAQIPGKPIPQHNIYTETPDVARPAVNSDRKRQNHATRADNIDINMMNQSQTVQEAPLRTCPICGSLFPQETTQRDFEHHVEYCLNNSTSEIDSPSPEDSEAASPVDITTPDMEMMECPVCSAVFPPSTAQQMFACHVESHFNVE